ncbi:hypothetical protein HanXRQr2_Chr12g0532171 [Helianthus annuus]|uniref:Endonuclease/exonuclease/phosphatase n=1 Tax=Helianthus annuus TaxID=4232 RepID=A0A9K3HF27_HELAN|nr:hypothetical protein HanXRQr2_Chr12g0532171 [Helianthus annuus]
MIVKKSETNRSVNFGNLWPNTTSTTLPKRVSDHCSLTLISDPKTFGPIPFICFNSWTSDPEWEQVAAKFVDEFCI